uniref:Uncharacterized protein n=1 Tax=Arundo donax TaxID=35708 RepID=A0A0A9GAG2_ARUDO
MFKHNTSATHPVFIRSFGRHLETSPLVEGPAVAAAASSSPSWRCSHSTTTWGR